MQLRIAIISGVCVEHDAISNAMRDQAILLREAGHEVRLFAHSADRSTAVEIEVVNSPMSLATHPFYAQADLAIFHFGVYYGMFNALLLQHAPRRVVHFHNVTPPEVLQGSARALSEMSLDQLSIAEYADEVWCVSPHNREVLLAHTDVSSPRVHEMGLRVPEADHPLPSRVAGKTDAVTVLTVGRFVEAKGLLELTDAVARLPPDLAPIRFVLAGSATYSDRAFMDRLAEVLLALPAHVDATVIYDPEPEELVGLYRSAHVFATASRHEGFCLPVFEALASGCRVVSSDAGALPTSVGPCGEVVPVGDVAALADALGQQIRSSRADVEVGGPTSPECRAHLSRFGTESIRSGLLAAVERVVRAPRSH